VSTAAPPPFLPDLEMLEEVGSGGMATVWKAYDKNRQEIVAVKLLNPELTTKRADLELFVAEERAMENIHHPGIVRSYDLRVFRDSWYYIMEYVDGYNFGYLLSRKRHLQQVDCLLICESVAAALDYAWREYGIVHCDIKPDNIMVHSDGTVKLTDLGLCRTFRALKEGTQQLDVPDHVLGTPAYISPEQIYGDVELDCRSDIYQLGASLYHLATGRVLFPKLDEEGMLRAHCSNEAQARDPREYDPSLTEGFCQLLEAMLIKDRNYRIAAWGDVIEMCAQVEKGGAFKPRATPGVSSVRLGPAPRAQ